VADPVRPNLEAAIERANELLRAHAVQQAPVDVQAIAEKEGARVVFEQLQNEVSGVLVLKNGVTMIAVNALHHPNRQRFTLAHELAHLKLHPHNPTVYVDDLMVHFRGGEFHRGPTPEEVEANTFAATLLMPESLLEKDLAGRTIDASDDDAVRALAQRYRVSQQALTIRLSDLGYVAGLPGAR